MHGPKGGPSLGATDGSLCSPFSPVHAYGTAQALAKEINESVGALCVEGRRPVVMRIRPDPLLHAFQPLLCFHRQRPQKAWALQGWRSRTCRSTATLPAEKATSIKYNRMRQVYRMAPPNQGNLILPGIKPGHFEVPRYGVVPEARTPRNQRPTPTMWPCEATKCTMVETTSNARVGSRYVRAWSIPNLVAKPSYGLIQWCRLRWPLNRINFPMLGQKLCDCNQSP